MRVAIFMDVYTPALETKDTGQLVLGFQELGYKCDILAVADDKHPAPDGKLSIRFMKTSETHSCIFWESTPYDLIICYTWLRKKYLPVLDAIRKSGKKVIVKADSDGRYNFPVNPRWGQDIVPLFSLRSFRIFLRKLKRRVLVNSYLGDLVKHIEMADGIIVESPGAYANIAAILVYAGKPELVSKLFPIQNPVGNSALMRELTSKRKLVVAVGEWTRIVGEGLQKNTECMRQVVSDFLRIEPEYEVAIIGDMGGSEKYFTQLETSQKSRLHICGAMGHPEMLGFLAEAQVFFMPSIAEGFSIAASEAVAMGCSIVGTPLECLVYLARGGVGGTISYDFMPNSVLGALLADVNRWKRGHYKATEIAQFWRTKLAPKNISRLILDSVAHDVFRNGDMRL